MYRIWGLHFSRWLLLLWPLRWLLRLEVKPDGLDSAQMKDMIGGRDVIYVIPRMNLVDVFVLNLLLRRMHLARVKLEARPNRIRPASVLAIRPKVGFIAPDRSDSFSTYLAAILSSDARVARGGVVLVPVSLFWSRGAEKNKRNVVLKALLADDHHANSLQKLCIYLVGGRKVHMHFGKPVELPNLSNDVDKENSIFAHARRIRRNLLIEFNRERTAALGPTLYEFNSVANWILHTKETQKFLASADSNPQRARKKALFYLKEIAAAYSYTTIRGFEVAFDFLWTRIFKGIRVRNFDAVAQVVKDGQLVWMPCHRSHLDYMLLPYVLYKKGLAVPHTAAGVNLSFWPAGPILRRGGAFFIRRSFSGNKIYSHIFTQYVHFLLHNSYFVEFFHEGGRSRIGKLLAPRTGITSMCVASILKRKAENTYFVPVYFGYDKVVEGDSYARELAGAKKQKENVWQLLGAIRHLFSNYGRVDVSFGTPIRFGDAWRDYFSRFDTTLPSELQNLPEDFDTRDPRCQTFVRWLARRVNQGINGSAVASGTTLLASVLLSQSEPHFSWSLLSGRIAILHWAVNRLGQSLAWKVATSSGSANEVGFVLSQPFEAGVAQAREEEGQSPIVPVPLARVDATIEKCVEEIMADGERWQFLIQQEPVGAGVGTGAVELTPLAETAPSGELEGRRFLRNPQKEMNLWWYRGTVFHVLAVPGLVATLLLEMPVERRSMAAVSGQLGLLRRIWDEEMFWPDETDTQVIVESAFKLFVELGLATSDSEGLIRLTTDPKFLETLKFFSDLVRPERELYSLQLAAAVYLAQAKGRFSRDELIQKAITAHRSAFLRGAANQPANLSRVFGARTFDALFRAGVFIPQERQLLTVSMTEIAPLANFFELSLWREFIL